MTATATATTTPRIARLLPRIAAACSAVERLRHLDRTVLATAGLRPDGAEDLADTALAHAIAGANACHRPQHDLQFGRIEALLDQAAPAGRHRICRRHVGKGGRRR